MIKFKKHCGIYTLEVEQLLSTNINEAWEFFSDPKNLKKITPDDIGFIITCPVAEKTYPGQIITYKIGIFPLRKTNWVTEITQVKTYEYFIDEQRFGPYRMWHHENRFKKTEKGVIMTDLVSYKIPFGLIGTLAYRLFIKTKLIKIFNFRYNFLERCFNGTE